MISKTSRKKSGRRGSPFAGFKYGKKDDKDTDEQSNNFQSAKGGNSGRKSLCACISIGGHPKFHWKMPGFEKLSGFV
jgi:hypothetical protein